MVDAKVQHKLAAIMAADVAGYSRLMEDDEQATVATLDQYRLIFREHVDANHGRIVDHAGDSVLSPMAGSPTHTWWDALLHPLNRIRPKFDD